jgi:hypothetical protein
MNNIVKALESIHTLLFANTALRTATGDRIYYARAPVGSTYPQVIYYDIASGTDYLVDFDSVTVQFSIWANDEFTALNISELIYRQMNRLGGIMSQVYITHTELIDRGALPETDQQLKGQFLRFVVRYRGQNIGG